MAGVVIRYSIDTTPLRRIGELFRSTGTDPAPLLNIWGGALESSTRARFDSGRGVGGVPWPVSQRVKRHGGKTLVDKANLERSVRYEVRAHVVFIGVADPTKPTGAIPALQFGSKRQTVAVRHQRTQTTAFGVPLPTPRRVTVRGHGRVTGLPARPFIGIDQQDRADLRSAAIDYLRIRLK